MAQVKKTIGLRRLDLVLVDGLTGVGRRLGDHGHVYLNN